MSANTKSPKNMAQVNKFDKQAMSKSHRKLMAGVC